MKKPNISEQLFEEFCLKNQIQLNRIKESTVPGEKRPDYEIIPPSGKILVEVKQFEANDDERKYRKQIEKRRWTDAYSVEFGTTAGSKIDNANKQLKSFSRGMFPTMIVLYNNMLINTYATHHYEITATMYGYNSVKGVMTPKRYTSTSAIATLHKGKDQQLLMYVFHNFYATVPLNIESFQGKSIKHYESIPDNGNVSGDFNRGWCEKTI